MRKTLSTDEAAKRRTSQLAAIHVMASKQLGLDRETYVALLQRVAGVSSSASLDGRGRQLVLDELRRLAGGTAKYRAHAAVPDEPENPRADIAAMIGKVSAILADGGRTWSYAHGMAKKMFKVARVEWLNPDQVHRIVAALSYDQKRRGKKS
jgi:phage gp16-like protein